MTTEKSGTMPDYPSVQTTATSLPWTSTDSTVTRAFTHMVWKTSSRTIRTNSLSTLQPRREKRQKRNSLTALVRLQKDSTATADSHSRRRQTSQEKLQRTSSGKPDIHSTGSIIKSSRRMDTHRLTVRSTDFTRSGAS